MNNIICLSDNEINSVSGAGFYQNWNYVTIGAGVIGAIVMGGFLLTNCGIIAIAAPAIATSFCAGDCVSSFVRGVLLEQLSAKNIDPDAVSGFSNQELGNMCELLIEE